MEKELSARDLREYLLSEFPQLKDKLAYNELLPHKDMEVFFHYVTDALKNEDRDLVIQCFRFSKNMASLADKFDLYTRNAFHVSFLQQFNPHDPQGLDVFSRIPPDIRSTLLCPFAIPHYWMRKKSLHLNQTHHKNVLWTIDHTVEQTCRFVQQTSCPGHFAIITLRLEPSLGEDTILFMNKLEQSQHISLSILEGIVEGIERFLDHLQEQGKPLSSLKIVLTHCQDHPVDSQRKDFSIAAYTCLENIFEDIQLIETWNS